MAKLEKKYHEELKLELEGQKVPAVQSGVEDEDEDEDADAEVDLRQQAEDAANLSEVGMSRKKRKLLQAMIVSLLITFCFSFFLSFILAWK